jgi:hypothetical protein
MFNIACSRAGEIADNENISAEEPGSSLGCIGAAMAVGGAHRIAPKVSAELILKTLRLHFVIMAPSSQILRSHHHDIDLDRNYNCGLPHCI